MTPVAAEPSSSLAWSEVLPVPWERKASALRATRTAARVLDFPEVGEAARWSVPAYPRPASETSEEEPVPILRGIDRTRSSSRRRRPTRRPRAPGVPMALNRRSAWVLAVAQQLWKPGGAAALWKPLAVGGEPWKP